MLAGYSVGWLPRPTTIAGSKFQTQNTKFIFLELCLVVGGEGKIHKKVLLFSST